MREGLNFSNRFLLLTDLIPVLEGFVFEDLMIEAKLVPKIEFLFLEMISGSDNHGYETLCA